MIEATNLTKRFGTALAVDGLNLSIPRGEIFAFLGPNGAGKTTTLKLLMQLVYPTSGDAEILGRPLGDPSVKRRIGYLPENPYFYDYLTAEELLQYFGRLFGYDAAERRRRIGADAAIGIVTTASFALGVALIIGAGVVFEGHDLLAVEAHG